MSQTTESQLETTTLGSESQAFERPAGEGRRTRRMLWGGMLLALAAVLVSVGVVTATMAAGKQATPVIDADVPTMKDGRVVFSATFAKRAGLEAAQVRSAQLTPVVSTVGMVTFDPRYVASVGTRLRGVVQSVRVYEGARVKRGQVLATLNSPELAEAESEVVRLRAMLRAAEQNATRVAALAEQSLSTQREAEQADAERSSYRALLVAAEQKVVALAGGKSRHGKLGVHTLVAPLDGSIVERNVTQGQLVEGDTVAFVVAQLDHVWVELDVFEHHIGAIRVGDEVVVKPLAGSGSEIAGRVAHVGAVIDQATRTAPVRIEVNNEQRQLRPGQAVDAKIETVRAAHEDATVIPARAVTFVDGAPTVFVYADASSVVPTKIELGATDGDDRQVLRGLSPGQRVVVAGVFELKSELFR